jgi:hypothetical protein
MTTKELLDGFAEDPLQFLSGKKRSDMTLDEVRQWTETMRQRRDVVQTFRASLGEERAKPAPPINIDDVI